MNIDKHTVQVFPSTMLKVIMPKLLKQDLFLFLLSGKKDVKTAETNRSE